MGRNCIEKLDKSSKVDKIIKSEKKPPLRKDGSTKSEPTKLIEEKKIQETITPSVPKLKTASLVCKEREFTVDGVNCFECPDYTRATDDHSKCSSDRCESSQVLHKNGKCENCPDG